MAATAKALFRGAATTTTTTTLYTTPSATTTVVTQIAVVNTSASAQTVTMFLNGIDILNAAAVPANTTYVLDLKQPLEATQTIQGGASATSVDLHVSGVEIT
jgi:hypothetical protein